MTAISTIKHQLFKPVDASSLAALRIVFGLTMAYYAFGLHTDAVIEYRYIQPNFFFSWPLFHWLHLKPWGPMGMMVHFTVLGVAACMVTLGACYRLSSVVLFLASAYIFLLERMYALNDTYLFVLLGLLMVCTQAHRWGSWDAWRHRGVWSRVIPYWQVWIFRFQLGCVYFFSGLAKATHADWLQARQMKLWVAHHFEGIPLLSTLASQNWAAYGFSYAGMLIDLSLPFMLCFRKTRLLGFALAVLFHVTNKLMLGLGLFPWVMLLVTIIIFSDPDMPEQLLSRARQKFNLKHINTPQQPASVQQFPYSRGVMLFLGLYAAYQIMMPLRHWLYPDPVNWTQRGQYLSWQMMNNNMKARINQIYFTKPDHIEAYEPVIITPDQKYFMSLHPDCIYQYAQELKKRLQKAGVSHPVVTMDIDKSLNGRPFMPLIDSSVNLADVDNNPFKKQDWIMPHPDEQ